MGQMPLFEIATFLLSAFVPSFFTLFSEPATCNVGDFRELLFYETKTILFIQAGIVFLGLACFLWKRHVAYLYVTFFLAQFLMSSFSHIMEIKLSRIEISCNIMSKCFIENFKSDTVFVLITKGILFHWNAMYYFTNSNGFITQDSECHNRYQLIVNKQFDVMQILYKVLSNLRLMLLFLLIFVIELIVKLSQRHNIQHIEHTRV